MAARQDIEAGKAHVVLYVKNSAFVKGLRDAETRLKNMGGNITKAGAALAGVGLSLAAPLAAAVATFANTGAAMDAMSKRTNTSVEALSELGYAATQSGADLSQVESAIGSMNATLAAATRLEAGAMDGLARLGLTAEMLKGQTPDKQLELVADKLAGVRDPAERAARAVAVLGGAGQALLPMLSQGSRGIQTLRDDAIEAGASMSTAQAAAGKNLKAAYDSVKASIMSVVLTIGGALEPEIAATVDAIKSTAAAVVKFVRDNRDLIVTAAKVAVGLMGAGAAIMAIGGTLTGLGAVFGSLATIATASITAIVAVFGLITSPAIVATAAIVGIGVAVSKWIGNFDAAKTAAGGLFNTLRGWTDSARSWFGDLADIAGDTWGGIVDAIAAGDLSLAAEVAFAGIRAAFVRVVATLQRGWQGVTSYFLETWSGVKEFFAGVFVDSFAAIESGWVSTITTLKSLWIDAMAAMNSAIFKLGDAMMPVLEAAYKIYAYFTDMSAEQLEKDLQRLRQNAKEGPQNFELSRKKQQEELSATAAKRKTEIESVRVGAKDVLRQEGDRERMALADRASAAIAAADAEVVAARKALTDARSKAATEAATTRAKRQAGAAPGMPPETVSERIAKVAGTFSAAGASMMGGGGSNLERIAATTLKTQKEQLAEQREVARLTKQFLAAFTVR